MIGIIHYIHLSREINVLRICHMIELGHRTYDKSDLNNRYCSSWNVIVYHWWIIYVHIVFITFIIISKYFRFCFHSRIEFYQIFIKFYVPLMFNSTWHWKVYHISLSNIQAYYIMNCYAWRSILHKLKMWTLCLRHWVA